MGLVLVELMGGEYGGDDRHAAVELHSHQATDDGFGDELVAVDAAVDDEAGGDDGAVAPASDELFGVERISKAPVTS